MQLRAAIALVVAAAGVAAGGFALGARASQWSVPPMERGAVAPDFSGATLEVPPRPRTISDYRGSVVLLNLWATWCVPCQVEMPSLESLYRRLGPDGLRVVAVSIDDPGNEDRIRDFVERYGLTFDILNEGTGAIENAYQSFGIPSTFLIDRRGVIRLKVQGAADWDTPQRRRQIEAVLNEQSTAPPAAP